MAYDRLLFSLGLYVTRADADEEPPNGRVLYLNDEGELAVDVFKDGKVTTREPDEEDEDKALGFYPDAGDTRADDAAFEEADHPRDEDGKFSTSGGGGGGKSTPGTATRNHVATMLSADGKVRTTAAGESLPEHIQKLKVPPAWTDVTYDPDPKANLLVTGKDAKGRRQAVYSAEFSAANAAAKFARIHELNSKFDGVKAQNDKAKKSSNPRTVAAADCAQLIMETGIRPGSDEDTGAKVKAYGATTLEGRHVVKTKDGVSLKFVGKKGVALDIPVTDPATVKMLLARKEKAGTGPLFPIDEKALLNHVHTLGGGGFKTKDFRTLVGTKTAMNEVAKLPKPTNEAEYKKAVMSVAKVVSTKLGNTPVIALQSYISPAVFAEWRIAA